MYKMQHTYDQVNFAIWSLILKFPVFYFDCNSFSGFICLIRGLWEEEREKRKEREKREGNRRKRETVQKIWEVNIKWSLPPSNKKSPQPEEELFERDI